MKELSSAVLNAPKSKIRKLFDMAAGRTDVISLGIGQPDNPSPQSLIDGTIKALNERKTMYAPTRGIPELRKVIAEKVKKENKIDADWEKNIIIANGGSQAITFGFAVTVNPGDEILINSPNFVSYFYCSQFFYGKTIEIPRNADLSPNFDKLKNNITKKLKIMLICSPNNPTGYVLNKKEWEELADIVIENDLYLISDEPYEKFVYDNNKALSPASLNGMFERTITLNCISKSFAAPGFRLGYVVASEQLINLMEVYMQYTIAGVNHPAQYGAVQAFREGMDWFPKVLKSYKERRDIIYERLKKMGFEVSKPGGAFYIMPSIKKFKMSADDFSMKLMEEKGVAVVPGDIFGKYS
ncbi:MAG: pyridoxal phosphate-dependent aminotransferase, partial [Promethearchaeota archaeon]